MLLLLTILRLATKRAWKTHRRFLSGVLLPWREPIVLREQ